MAAFAVGFTTSAMRMWPAYCPSTATWMTVPTWRQGAAGTPIRSMSLSLPAATVWPSTWARTPWPAISWISPTRLRSRGLP